ncbi:MAG: oligoribonuclease [Micromonosporaceae bacterium]|nr:oligoribonuclease [Micromonosporaceae bacterium]
MNDLLVWIDCEMTGLDLHRDALIEVAVLITDPDLNILGDGVDVVIHTDDETLASMNDVVRTMHAKSGLTEAVRASPVSVPEAEQLVLEYVRRHVPDPRTAPLCGNSIATDRGFIARDMPTLDEHLHYRMIDVSSVKELCRRWFPRTYYGLPPKGLAHRALADIKESIRELEYYRRTVFVPPPGLDVDSAKAVAAKLVSEEQPAGEVAGPAGPAGSDGSAGAAGAADSEGA